MPHDTQISVIIPAFNEERLIGRAIESVDAADEVIVVDGGSDDRTVAIAEQAQTKVLHGKKGRGAQLRTGARLATGDVLLFLHADSWLGNGAVTQLRHLAASGGSVFGCYRQCIDDSRFRFRVLEFGNQVRATWLGLPYGDQATFVDRNTYERIGGIEDVPLMEDVLLSKKLRGRVRPSLLAGPVHVSARRWARHGVLQQTLKNWSILSAFCLGVSPVKLARWYR